MFLGLLVDVVVPLLARLCPASFLVVISVCGVKSCAPMSSSNYPIMSWNVRGLNSSARHSAVSEMATSHRLGLLCLQETKIESWSPALVRDIGGSALEGCAVLPADGTRGGAAIFWDKALLNVQTHTIGQFSITARVSSLQSADWFWLTNVYGPSDDGRKDDFLEEMTRAPPPTLVSRG